MAKSATLKIPSDIEYRVIADAFGLMISSAGLLGGTMVNQRSFDYWLEDIVILVIVAWFLFRLYRDLLSTMTLYKDVPTRRPKRLVAESVSGMPENVVIGQLPAVTLPTADQVVEEVARRIDEKRTKAQKNNKFTN
jgi:hypothetical protein